MGMTNPPYMLEHLDAIAQHLNHPRAYAFLHVPVQSGSNAVLETMKREYTVEQFRRVADLLLAKVPSLSLSTDIICGMPCLLYTSPSPRDLSTSRMPSSA